MARSPFVWLGKNTSSLLLAFFLSVVVWVSAVTTADPNEERLLTPPVPIEIIGKDPGLLFMGEYPTQVNLTLKAPSSVWNQLTDGSAKVRAWVDLSAIGEGVHNIPVHVQIDLGLVRMVHQDPEEISITLEPLVTQQLPVSLIVSGEPPVGYQVETPIINPAEVTLSGPRSLVSRVKEARVSLNIAGASEMITRTITISPVDESGRTVSGVTITPNAVSVIQPINLLGGYRNVIVRVVTTGLVASGYRLTNYFVTPSSVIVFSSDPQLVNELPGYVETRPLDLTGVEDDFEALLEIDLPVGVSAISGTRVLVQVSVAAIESSLAISLPVDIVGLTPGLEAIIAPATVDVFLSGPVPVLNDLEPSDIRVKVDLTGFEVGVYQIIPVVDFLPPRVQKISILPATVEVTITLAPTPTPTATLSPGEAAQLTPTPSATSGP